MYQKADIELIQAIKAGDILAFENLVKKYQQPLFRFVMRVVWNEKDAEEIVQDTLFNTYKNIDKIDTTKTISTYIFAIAKNTAISVLRRKKVSVSFDKTVDVEDDAKIFENLIQKETAQHIHLALNQLEEKYRLVIRLYYFEDLAYTEISRKCRIPLNSVRTILRRAKIQLKTILNYETY
jgi:RNA polymerase sigma-70 factor, ECF subfamily